MKLFKNLGLKIVLWLPYAITMVFLFSCLIIIMMRYDIPIKEMYLIGAFVLLYGGFLELSISVRRKYWPITKLLDIESKNIISE